MNPYDVLGIKPGSTADEIKKAYRKLAKKHHPDVSDGDDTKFKQINEAYSMLTTNSTGHSGQRAPGQDPFDGFDSFFKSHFGFGRGGPFSNASRSRSAARGSDIRIKIEVSLYDIVAGADKDVTIRTEDPCVACNTTGASSLETCTNCQGSGFIRQPSIGNFASMAFSCPKCHGRGRQAKAVCQVCSGKGAVINTRVVKITIPSGTSPSSSLQLRGEGGPGLNGGPAGDLVVILRLRTPKSDNITPEDLEVLKRVSNA